MKSIKSLFALVAFALLASISDAHPCEKDAIAQAYNLIKFNSGNDERAEVDESSLKVLKKIKNPAGGKTVFDVIEIYGSVYKGTFRMRFIYYTDNYTCARIGQEIIGLVDYQ